MQLLSEVFRNFQLQMTDDGVQEFARGATRCVAAWQQKQYIDVLKETVKLTVAVYKALPTREQREARAREREEQW